MTVHHNVLWIEVHLLMESMIFASANYKCSLTVACLRAIIRAMSR